ncbi:MAG: HAMP domain-containing sensor histidine kinase [Pseudomonadota bacterium]
MDLPYPSSTSLTRFCLRAFPGLAHLTIWLCVAGITLDLIVEYNIADGIFFIYKDIVNLSIIGIATLLANTVLRRIDWLLATCLYVVLGSMFVGILLWEYRANFDISTYYIKFEIVSWLFVFVAGILLPRVHLYLILGIKVAFTMAIISLPFLEADIAPYATFLFLTVAAGAGLSVFSQGLISRLDQREEEARNKALDQVRKTEETGKMELLHILGHDVKQPFGQIESLVNMLQDKSTPLSDKEIYDMMRQSVENGHLILANLVSWAEASSYLRPGQIATCDVAEVVQRVVQVGDSQCKLKKIQLHNTVDNASARIDDHTLFVVLRNLVSNAIKFTESGGVVEIKSSVSEESVALTIKDNGVGMPQRLVDALLSRGKNEPRQGTSQEKGTGLGIEICKDLLERNHSVLTIDSSEGQGTSMTIIIPKAT